MINNACPFAPGEVKPRSIPVNSNHEGLLNRITNGKLIVLVLSLVGLTLVYSHSYSDLNWEGSSVLFNDWYIVKMSLYTYLTSLISFFIREHRRNQR